MKGTVLTAESVRLATAECARVGRSAFRRRYGYRPARDYVLVIAGEEYDPRPIVGVAWGYATGQEALRADEFPGSDSQRVSWKDLAGGGETRLVSQLLSSLGFEVRQVTTKAKPADRT